MNFYNLSENSTQLLESINQPVAIVLNDGTFIKANKLFYTFFQYQKGNN